MLFIMHISCVLCFTKSSRTATVLAEVFIFAMQLPVLNKCPKVQQLICPAFSAIFNINTVKLNLFRYIHTI